LQDKAKEENERLSKVLAGYTEHLLTALREGGCDPQKYAAYNLFPFMGQADERTFILFEEKNTTGYRLSISLTGEFDREEMPLYGGVQVKLALERQIPMDVVISRRTDGPWQASARGTHFLPIGHPLGELAHADRFLGLSQKLRHGELDDRTMFRGCMEIGRIFARATH
jgi:hypothetical protein